MSSKTDNRPRAASPARKRRRIMSCESCRKLKTRCDRVQGIPTCHRCSVLKLDCSLKNSGDVRTTPSDNGSTITSCAIDTISNNKKILQRTNIENQVSEANSAVDQLQIDNLTTEEIIKDTIHQRQQQQQQLSNMELILQKLNSFEKRFEELSANMDELRSASGHNYSNTNYKDSVIHSNYNNNTSANTKMANLALCSSSKDREESLVSNTLINNTIDNIQLDFYTSSSPASLTDQIDYSLFQKSNDYATFRTLCNEFIELFTQNQSFYQKLAKSFLKISHFWIIPGGIKNITPEYVFEHPFISCIFVLIGMCFDDSHNYVNEQKTLFELAMKLLGKALLIDNLTDHDIEAIVYIATFNISRKSEANQFKLNKWLITNFAMNHIIIAFRFQDIFTKVLLARSYDKDQLFHLRIYNSLLIAFLQASLDNNRPVFITNDYLNFAKLILKFPEGLILVGDKIIVSKLDLLFLVVNLINNEKFAVGILNDIKDPRLSRFVDEKNMVLRIPEMENWKQQNKHLIRSDIAKILINAFYYYYIYLSKRILKDLEIKYKILYPLQMKSFTLQQLKSLDLLKKICFKTSIKYCFKLLRNTLDLNAYFIKGSPMFQFDQIIYASLTLLNSLASMTSFKNKRRTIELIGKNYWNLKKLGIKKNDATDTLEKVLKLIIDAAIKDHSILFDTLNHASSSSKNASNSVDKTETAATTENGLSVNSFDESDIDFQDDDDDELEVDSQVKQAFRNENEIQQEGDDGDKRDSSDENLGDDENEAAVEDDTGSVLSNIAESLSTSEQGHNIRYTTSDIRKRTTSFSASKPSVKTALEYLPLKARSYSDTGHERYLFSPQQQQQQKHQQCNQFKIPEFNASWKIGNKYLLGSVMEHSHFPITSATKITSKRSTTKVNDFQNTSPPATTTASVDVTKPINSHNLNGQSNNSPPIMTTSTSFDLPSQYRFPILHQNFDGLANSPNNHRNGVSNSSPAPSSVISPELQQFPVHTSPHSNGHVSFAPHQFHQHSHHQHLHQQHHQLHKQTESQPQLQSQSQLLHLHQHQHHNQPHQHQHQQPLEPESLFLFNVDQTSLDNILMPDTSEYDNFYDFYRDLFINNDMDGEYSNIRT